jgi:DNA-nicking Smr family endonuclease
VKYVRRRHYKFPEPDWQMYHGTQDNRPFNRMTDGKWKDFERDCETLANVQRRRRRKVRDRDASGCDVPPDAPVWSEGGDRSSEFGDESGNDSDCASISGRSGCSSFWGDGSSVAETSVASLCKGFPTLSTEVVQETVSEHGGDYMASRALLKSCLYTHSCARSTLGRVKLNKMRQWNPKSLSLSLEREHAQGNKFDVERKKHHAYALQAQINRKWGQKRYHGQLAQDFKRRAAESHRAAALRIFDFVNPDFPESSWEVDLHGQRRVNGEAVLVLETAVERALAHRRAVIRVITGTGSHSRGLPALLPVVREWLDNNRRHKQSGVVRDPQTQQVAGYQVILNPESPLAS